MTDPRPAATVLLARDGADGLPEVYMLRRAASAGFMAGVDVFPGGRVDTGDHALAITWRAASDTPPTPDDDARVAAIRECFEEAGVIPATSAGCDLPALANARASLLRGDSEFGDVTAALRAAPDLDALVPFARWITPPMERRRYDTLFFAVRAPEDAGNASACNLETDRGRWVFAQEELQDYARGRCQLAPPTLVILHQIARFSTVDAILAWARAQDVYPIHPHLCEVDEAPALALPGDPRHPERAAPRPLPTLVRLEEGRWQVG